MAKRTSNLVSAECLVQFILGLIVIGKRLMERLKCDVTFGGLEINVNGRK